jgi:predicted HTH transcriptional regulator
MYLYGSIEQVGTGTEMIVEKCIEHGLRAPDFVQDGNFVVTLWRNGENVTENGRERKIMEIILAHPKISTTVLAQKLFVSRMTLHRDLEKLKTQGLLERIDPDKGGYWKVHG